MLEGQSDMSAAPVIISGVRPSSLVPLEPSVSEVHIGMDFGSETSSQISFVKTDISPDVDRLLSTRMQVMPMSSIPELKIEPAVTCEGYPAADEALAEAARRILDTCSNVFSMWFSAMRSCIRRDRVRQCLFKEDHGLPNSAKIPYQRQPVTAAEQSVVDIAESTIRCLFGDSVADYARDKFEHAIDTGDLRAFKIRLLVIKARDCLQKDKSPLLPWFVKGMEQCIDKAEELAGCIPDPSPRRLSKAEQEKKRNREEKAKRLKDMHPELPLVWIAQENKDPINQDIEGSASIISTDKSIPITPAGSRCELNTIDCNKAGKDVEVLETTQDSDSVTVTVTETHSHSCSGKKSSKKSRSNNAKSGVVRKAREYNTVEQILDDIEDGKIVPYESSDEICADLKAGLITPVEALMFTNALDRYCPEGFDDANNLDNDMESVGLGEDSDEDEIEDDIEESRSSFSYNPNGFAGADRFGCESDDWDSDNEW